MIRKTYTLLLFVAFGLGCRTEPKTIESKATTLYETKLFRDVQLQGLFKDSKTFVDLVPNAHFLKLEQAYLEAKENPGFDLKAFLDEHFSDGSMKSLTIETDTTRTMYEHIEWMWDNLKRGPDTKVANSSRIPLPHQYIVPGGRFQEIYYWDSYFTIEGLLTSGRTELAKNMVANFAFLLDSIGHIPNGTRNYYLSRSQPPFFSLMVAALARHDENILTEYGRQMEKEYDFFMKGETSENKKDAFDHVVLMPNGGQMNRYYDVLSTPRPEAYKEDLHLAKDAGSASAKTQLLQDLRSAAESGWDFSSRWFATDGVFASTQTTSLVPVDLNCLMYSLETQLANVYTLKGNDNKAKHFANRATQRSQLINEYLWDESMGFYMDYNFKTAVRTKELSLAGAFPLFFGLASPEQAEEVKNVLVQKFLKPGGLVTTLKNSGQQWDAPNGWAPLQWVAVKGLLRYGYEDEAVDIMKRWLALNKRVYKNTGKMMEKYNVEDLTLLSGGGEYETQDGFGWTNAVALDFKKIMETLEEKP